MGLMRAATDGIRLGTTWLYFALYRFPIHSAPLLLQTALERKHEAPTQASQERPARAGSTGMPSNRFDGRAP
jgi:hypothetical protein